MYIDAVEYGWSNYIQVQKPWVPDNPAARISAPEMMGCFGVNFGRPMVHQIFSISIALVLETSLIIPLFYLVILSVLPNLIW